MTFRARLTVAAAAAVAVAVVASSAGAYLVVRAKLRGEVDGSLRARAAVLRTLPIPDRLVPGGATPGRLAIPAPRVGELAGLLQLVDAEGNVVLIEGQDDLARLAPEAAALAAVGSGETLRDERVPAGHVRVLTVVLRDGLALQLGRSLAEVDRTLAQLRWLLIGLAAGGVVLAALLGALVARAALNPLRRLDAAVEHVSETTDLSRRLEAGGRDELGRLARSFNRMLGALEASRLAQRALVADASHELRTPLTSVRTNVEVLGEDVVSDDERREIVGDVLVQLDELGVLVDDLVDLARGDVEPGEPEPVRLDLLVADAVERARRHAPDLSFALASEPTIVVGVPARLERAVRNLLDNAAKWSPPGGRVEVAVAAGEVTVRDHGPGIDAEDLPHVFDRFYRAEAARGLPGSGLGLSIVRQVAEAHGGSVSAEPAGGGGALLRLRLAGHGSRLRS